MGVATVAGRCACGQLINHAWVCWPPGYAASRISHPPECNRARWEYLRAELSRRMLSGLDWHNVAQEMRRLLNAEGRNSIGRRRVDRIPRPMEIEN